MKVETLIAGGGLAGLSCARILAEAGRPYLLNIHIRPGLRSPFSEWAIAGKPPRPNGR